MRQPGAYFFTVLMGHGHRDLADVVQVVDDPHGKQLFHRDGTEPRMGPAQGQLCFRQAERLEACDILPAQRFKGVEQFADCLALAGVVHRIAIEGVKRSGLAVFEDDLRPWQPVRQLAVNQVTDDIERAEGLLAVIALYPRLTQIAQHGLQHRRSAGQYLDGSIQLKIHGLAPFLSAELRRPTSPRHGHHSIGRKRVRGSELR